ncbi:MAG: hypothetical protein K2I04_06030 [Muribaculaceae bacterium]|nr:hypothetical protein [Muribaculaceae bacterium]
MKNIITAASRKALAAFMAVVALVMCATPAGAAPAPFTGTVLDGAGL